MWNSIKAVLDLNAVHERTEMKGDVTENRCMSSREAFDRIKEESLNLNLTGSSLVLVAVCKKRWLSYGVKMSWWNLKPLCFYTTSRVRWSMNWTDWSKLTELWPHVVRGKNMQIWQVSGSWLSGSEEVEKYSMREGRKLGEDELPEELIHGKDCHTSSVTVALRTAVRFSSNHKLL